ncbi:MAG: amidohydrolase family protein [Acidimicrobiaceae bacterium]|nr:amidohydrolase family protein [Acidimicrobiaceae bacterium]
MPATQVTPEYDLVLSGGTVVTLDDDRRVIEPGAVAISGNRIAAVDSRDRVETSNAGRTIDCTGCVVLPGFIDCHSHLAQSVIKTLGEGLAVWDWLSELTFPVGDAITTEEAVAGTRLAAMEAARAGITSVVDNQYMPPDPETTKGVADAIESVGIRGAVARGMTGTRPAAMAFRASGARPNYYTTSEELDIMADLLSGWSSDRLVTIWPGPLNIAFNDQEMIAGCVELARRFVTKWHTHCCESKGDPGVYRQAYGTTPVAWLHSEGLLGPEATLAHAIWLSTDEIAMLGETGAGVAHNPVSNAYLASGTMALTEMLEAGAVVGLGTDGPAVGHRQDPFEVMKQAAFAQRIRAGNAAVIDSETILETAALGGAAFVGFEVGVLAPGRLADVAVVDVSAPNCAPRQKIATTVVNSLTGPNVRTVVVDGRIVVEDARCVHVDEGEVIEDANRAISNLSDRVGLERFAVSWAGG